MVTASKHGAFGALTCSGLRKGQGMACCDQLCVQVAERGGNHALKVIQTHSQAKALQGQLVRLEEQVAGEVEASPHRCQQLGTQIHSGFQLLILHTVNICTVFPKVTFPPIAHMLRNKLLLESLIFIDTKQCGC